MLFNFSNPVHAKTSPGAVLPSQNLKSVSTPRRSLSPLLSFRQEASKTFSLDEPVQAPLESSEKLLPRGCHQRLGGGVPMGAHNHRRLLHLFRHSIEN